MAYRLEELVGTTWTVRQSTAALFMNVSGKPVGTYQYQVRACRHASDVTYCGQPTATLSVQVTPEPPRIPEPPSWITTSNPRQTPSTDGRYTVSWAESAYATSYQLQEKYCYGDPVETCEQSWRPLTLSPINARQWSPPTPKTGYGKYTYQVKACSSLGCSPWKGPTVAYVELPNVLPAMTRISSIAPNPRGWELHDQLAPCGAGDVLREHNGTAWGDLPDRPTGTSWHPATPKPNGYYYYVLKSCNLYGCTPFNPETTSSEVRVDIPTSTPMTPPTGFSVVPGALRTLPPTPHKFRWNMVEGASSYKLREEDLTCPQNDDIVTPIGANEPQPFRGIYPRLTTCSGQERDPSRFQYSLQACNGSTCSDWTPTLNVTVTGRPERPEGSTTTYRAWLAKVDTGRNGRRGVRACWRWSRHE